MAVDKFITKKVSAMTRKNFVLDTLLEKGEVIWKPHGNSMVPKVHSGDQVKVIHCQPSVVRVGDIVYAKVKGSHYLHLLTAIDASRGYQISNNHGYVNGWTDAKNIFGLCVQVKDKVLLSEQDLQKRISEVIESIEIFI